MKKYKEEKGSITLFVLIALLFFVGILTTSYIATTNSKRAQDEAAKQMASVYGKDVDNMEGLYQEAVEKKESSIASHTPAYLDKLSHLEGSIEEGYVVKDASGNEFVWIPVEKVIYKQEISMTSQDYYQDSTNKINLVNQVITKITNERVTPMAIKVNLTDTKEVNYIGVLYEYLLDTTITPNEVRVIPITYDKTGYREPANLSSDTTAKLSSWTSTLYQQEFNTMIEKVNKNGGFYIGRYETSLINNVVQSKKNQEVWLAKEGGATWHTLYDKQKGLSSGNITSHMIWGSQWDQVMIWMKDIPNTANGSFYVLNSKDMGNFSGGTYNTGMAEAYLESSIIKVKNIYDLAGNYAEVTMEAFQTDARTYRGDDTNSFRIGGIVSKRKEFISELYSVVGTRLALY